MYTFQWIYFFLLFNNNFAVFNFIWIMITYFNPVNKIIINLGKLNNKNQNVNHAMWPPSRHKIVWLWRNQRQSSSSMITRSTNHGLLVRINLINTPFRAVYKHIVNPGSLESKQPSEPQCKLYNTECYFCLRIS